MSQYYLAAQLPSLDAISETTPIPITEERFYDLCSRFLSKSSLDTVSKLTLSPPKTASPTGNTLLDAWSDGERQLRLALGTVRAKKLKKDFDIGQNEISAKYLQYAKAATEISDPMEAEKFLNRCRLEMLEELRPTDSFSDRFIFYYGLKLKLLMRIRGFDEESGRKAYKNIYSSIINGGRQEATQ